MEAAEVEAAVEADGGGRETRPSAGNGRGFMAWVGDDACTQQRRWGAGGSAGPVAGAAGSRQKRASLPSSMRYSLKLCEQVTFPSLYRTVREFAIHRYSLGLARYIILSHSLTHSLSLSLSLNRQINDVRCHATVPLATVCQSFDCSSSSTPNSQKSLASTMRV